MGVGAGVGSVLSLAVGGGARKWVSVVCGAAMIISIIWVVERQRLPEWSIVEGGGGRWWWW